MKDERRRELIFQTHIIESYKLYGGTGRKWAAAMQSGMPDLVLSMPKFGGHFAEVKHRPEFGVSKMCMPNPLTKLQRAVLMEFSQAGSLVLGYVVGSGSNSAAASTLYAFQPWLDELDATKLPHVHYVLGAKYYVNKLLEEVRIKNGN